MCGSALTKKEGSTADWLMCTNCYFKKATPKPIEISTSAIEKVIGSTALAAIKESPSNCIILINMKSIKSDKFVIELRLVRYENSDLTQKTGEIEIDPIPIGNIGQIRAIIRRAVDENFLKEGDSVIAMADETLGIGFNGLMMFFNIDEKFMMLTTLEIRKELEKSVFDSILEIAREIAKEGREGRKIGTAFIIGDHQNVLKNSRQLILNPLEGHPLERRNITDASFKETIKELAQLDGAFVVDKDGFVHTAGSYLTVKPDNINLQGLGSRHQACAAITKETKAIAVCISESGGTIRVFNNGEIIIEEKP